MIPSCLESHGQFLTLTHHQPHLPNPQTLSWHLASTLSASINNEKKYFILKTFATAVCHHFSTFTIPLRLIIASRTAYQISPPLGLHGKSQNQNDHFHCYLWYSPSGAILHFVLSIKLTEGKEVSTAFYFFESHLVQVFTNCIALNEWVNKWVVSWEDHWI